MVRILATVALLLATGAANATDVFAVQAVQRVVVPVQRVQVVERVKVQRVVAPVRVNVRRGLFAPRVVRVRVR